MNYPVKMQNDYKTMTIRHKELVATALGGSFTQSSFKI